MWVFLETNLLWEFLSMGMIFPILQMFLLGFFSSLHRTNENAGCFSLSFKSTYDPNHPYRYRSYQLRQLSDPPPNTFNHHMLS